MQLTEQLAKALFNNSNDAGKKLLVEHYGQDMFNKNILDTVKTFDDALAVLNIKKEDFDAATAGLPKDEAAYRRLKLVATALNEGWKPNWDDDDEIKYMPYFNMSPSGFSYVAYDYSCTHSSVGSRLCFRSAALAKYAGTQFLDIYKTLMTF